MTDVCVSVLVCVVSSSPRDAAVGGGLRRGPPAGVAVVLELAGKGVSSTLAAVDGGSGSHDADRCPIRPFGGSWNASLPPPIPDVSVPKHARAGGTRRSISSSATERIPTTSLGP